jgi:hypothetical protein
VKDSPAIPLLQEHAAPFMYVLHTSSTWTLQLTKCGSYLVDTTAAVAPFAAALASMVAAAGCISKGAPSMFSISKLRQPPRSQQLQHIWRVSTGIMIVLHVAGGETVILRLTI